MSEEMDARERLFSTAALAVLNSQQYDPGAKGRYEMLSGGLMWPDERPHRMTREEANLLGVMDVYRYLIAYRASITLGEERVDFRAVWDQVVQHAPNWPGLRPERRGEKARKRLLAGQRRAYRCLDELEKKFDEERADKGMPGDESEATGDEVL